MGMVAIGRVPVAQPLLVAVLEGHKEVHLGGRTDRFEAGELPVFPTAVSPDAGHLSAGAGDPGKGLAPRGSVQSRTDFGTEGYGGVVPWADFTVSRGARPPGSGGGT
jgi:hypothetical protein